MGIIQMACCFPHWVGFSMGLLEWAPIDRLPSHVHASRDKKSRRSEAPWVPWFGRPTHGRSKTELGLNMVLIIDIPTND